jgi:hypothetical protein
MFLVACGGSPYELPQDQTEPAPTFPRADAAPPSLQCDGAPDGTRECRNGDLWLCNDGAWGLIDKDALPACPPGGDQ